MKPEDLTDDAKVILLLCGQFGKEACPEGGAAPLGVADYGRFSTFLHDRGLRPATLLGQDVLDGLEAGMSPVAIPRIRGLLARGAAMSFAVESWMNKGLWILCRSDAGYPRRLKRQLREMAPPILFGAGDPSLLERGGLAIVGSRNIGPEQETFASLIANRCASEGVQVVSGGARGVDRVAMSEALASGGTVIGVMADSLLKSSLQKAHREALHDRRLVLISTVHPEAGFNVGAAMARNKFIYALADHALVVQAEFQKGGTWAGAIEELERPGGRPVFIRAGFSPAKAEKALMAKGALSFPELASTFVLRDLLQTSTALASESTSWGNGELRLREEPLEPTPEEPATASPVKPTSSDTLPPESGQPADPPTTVFDAVWPVLRNHVAEPIQPADLAQVAGILKAQAEDWMKQAHKAGLVRKLNKPVRYVLDDGAVLNLK